MARVALLGGYGTAGGAVADALVRETEVDLVLAGRDAGRAAAAAQALNGKHGGGRVSGRRADASDRASLAEVLRGAQIVVVASSTMRDCACVAEAALDAGTDYFDLQLSSPRKLAILRALAPRIERAGRCFITDGGYHPGIPAALVRYVALRFDALDSAVTAGVFRLPWRQHHFSAASVQEFTGELREHRPAFFQKGYWQESWAETRSFDFGPPFGKQRCAPMALEELRQLTGATPGLRETGFFVNGFDDFTSNVVIPLGLLTVRSLPVLTRLFQWSFLWSVRKFAGPPYGAVMVVEAEGTQGGQRAQLRLRLSHEDAYVLTALPVVACLRQYLTGAIRRPGLHWQANLVEPVEFFEDLTRMGLRMEVVVPAG